MNTKTVFLLAALGSGLSPIVQAAAPPAPEAHLGKTVYDQHCAACHGLNGLGNGGAAIWLYPKPRNFSSGLFKIKSTPAGFLPTDDDFASVEEP